MRLSIFGVVVVTVVVDVAVEGALALVKEIERFL